MKFLFYFLLPILFYSCTRDKINVEKEKKILKQTEIDFSNISKQKGMAAAFIEYMDSSAVLLRPGRFPLEGKDARRFISGTDDSGYILTWVPQNVIISKSGDIGYTYGTWTSYPKKWNADSATRGTYISIWKRQKMGGWKVVLDSGNEGVGQP